ncbi:Hsp20/alpha crystallin family protein [Halostella litorea]|uniref:Hsp20/alpha crystallin family protein n=1 Tax=Halostella litorea TaxID=2528831 RepID=UPI0010923043|nr:Hsp20/alpha crystallin family protein [Halostella litorea]
MQRNPFDDFQELLDRMSRQAEEGLLRGAGADLRGVAVDVAERDDEFVVTADLPGYEADDIDLTVADDRLHLSAERSEERAVEGDDGARYHRRERRHQSANRTVRLPDAVDESAVTAEYEHGVLTVTLPKREEPSGGRRIDID